MSKSIEERARLLVDYYIKRSWINEPLADAIAGQAATLCRQIERETIERCAKVAEERDLSIMSSTVVDAEARKIAATIRALAEKEGG